MHTAYPSVLLKIILFILYLKPVQKEKETNEIFSQVFHFKITADKTVYLMKIYILLLIENIIEALVIKIFLSPYKVTTLFYKN